MKKTLIAAAMTALCAAPMAQAEVLKGNLTGNPNNAAFETCHEGKRVVLKLQMSPNNWNIVQANNELMFIQALDGLKEQRRYRQAQMNRLSMVVEAEIKMGGHQGRLYQGTADASQLLMIRAHQGPIRSCDGFDTGALITWS